MTNQNKVVSAWIIMEIEEITDVTDHLSVIGGPVLKSNFVEPIDFFEMPVMAFGLAEVEEGDTFKAVYFTTRGELDEFLAGETGGFTDTGLRYLKKTGDGWDLIYQDSKPKSS